MDNNEKNYQEQILEIMQSNIAPRLMRTRLADFHENDLADVFETLNRTQRKKMCWILDVETLSDIFEYADEEKAAIWLDDMDVKKAAAILSGVEADALVDVLENVPKEKRAILIDLMDDEAKRDIALLDSFDDDEIGSKLTTNYVVVSEPRSVKESMRSLIEQAAKNDNISTIFFVDEYKTFYGAMDLKDLIIARQDVNVEELIVTSYPYVYGHELIDDVIEKLKDYEEDSIPVLDNDNHLIWGYHQSKYR